MSHVDFTDFEILATQLFSYFLLLFICFRIVAFNFFWKSKKRKLSLIYDVCLIVATSAWLIAIHDIWFSLEYSLINSVTQFAGVIYLFAIIDIFYNRYNLKHEGKENTSIQ